MYTRQVIVAALAGSIAAYTIYQNTHSVPLAIGVLVFTYVSIRIILTTLFRTRHWLQSGSFHGSGQSCPQCGQYIRRLSGDWILECRRCGWKAGWPLVRWLTRSVPSIQFRRSLTLANSLAILFAGLLIVMVTGVPVASVGPSGNGNSVSDVDTSFSDPSSDSNSGADIQKGKVEELVFQNVNDRRAERSMSPLDWNDRAALAARKHAEDMAENNYFSHTSQDGETQQERYAFCRGGENAAQTWVYKRVEKPNGGTEYHTTNEELATGIVEIWMNSDPHRERGIYGPWWTSAGVGIEMSDSNKVYAVMGLCSQ